ncbi:MAG: 5'-nucleotidase [Litorilinea sp.]|nr:MAG: 5'-nucleotidase [Litorilinea sp.]
MIGLHTAELNNAPPGCLRLVRAPYPPAADPTGALYLLVGDATAGPVEQIVPVPGISLPTERLLPDDVTFRLKVLHFNDLHGHVARFTPHGTQPVFSRMAWRIGQARRQAAPHPHRAVLILAAGDDLVGAVFDELLGDGPETFRAHVGYRLYSAAGVDACAMGNHDLDRGTRLLAHALEQEARFPLLTANLTGCPWLVGRCFPAALFLLKGLRVGVIGLTTPAQIAPQPNSPLRFVDPVQVLHNLLPAFRPLCDVCILLSHLGYSLESASAAVQLAGDVELAASLPPGSVHLIVGGHTHHVLNEQGLSARNIVNGIPIVQAGTLGRYLGEVDITVARAAAVTNVRLTPTADLPVDEAFERRHVQPLIQQVQAVWNRVLGTVDDNPELGTDMVRNSFAAMESPLANFIADALVARCRRAGYPVDLAMVDASCLRCGLPPGPLTFGHWFNIMPFADTIRLCRMTGSQLQQLLMDNARRADRPGEPHTERGFLQFSQEVRYTLELGESRSRAQARDITVDGIPLEAQLERPFLVACTSFVGLAAADWERTMASRSPEEGPLLPLQDLPRQDTGLFLRDELVAYIMERGGVTANTGARRDGRLQILEPVAQAVGR